MNCRHCRKHIFERTEGRLSEPLAGEVARHLEDCPACRAEASALARLVRRIDRDARLAAGRPLGGAIMEEIAARRIRPPQVERKRSRIIEYKGRLGMAVAAIILITFGAMIFTDRQGTRASALEQAIEAAQRVRTLHVIEEVPIEALKNEASYEGALTPWAAKALAEFKDAGKPLVTRYEAWGQFDDKGDRMRVKYERPVTRDGYKVSFWYPDRVEVWFKTKNIHMVIRPGALPDIEIVRYRDLFSQFSLDAKLQLKELQTSVAGGSATMTAEPSGQLSRFRVTRRDSPGEYQIYTMDPASKLLQSVEYYSDSDGKNRLIRLKRFLDYDKAVDSAVWEIAAASDARVNNLPNQVAPGLAQGDMSDKDISKELVRQFFQALIDKDYQKAGSLVEGGVSGEFLKESYGAVTYVRIVSIGEPVSYPENGPGSYELLCRVELEENGRRETDDLKMRVWRESGRWVIIGGV